VGLKPRYVYLMTMRLICLNRTSVGLKLKICNNQSGGVSPPQSNQRGIETQQPSSIVSTNLAPQSNQRGIETLRARLVKASSEVPQSNQRGIETCKDIQCSRKPLSGLNRTSVGLKRARDTKNTQGGRLPQSNQRGIETEWESLLDDDSIKPQSNQRGIETETTLGVVCTTHPQASIEPAWD